MQKIINKARNYWPHTFKIHGAEEYGANGYSPELSLDLDDYDILWTNAAPTSSFASQTITNIPWENYNYVIVFWVINTDHHDNYSSKIMIPQFAAKWGMRGFGRGLGEGQAGSRDATFFEHGIYFSSGFANSTSANNKICVPIEIVGVRQQNNTFNRFKSNYNGIIPLCNCVPDQNTTDGGVLWPNYPNPTSVQTILSSAEDTNSLWEIRYNHTAGKPSTLVYEPYNVSDSKINIVPGANALTVIPPKASNTVIWLISKNTINIPADKTQLCLRYDVKTWTGAWMGLADADHLPVNEGKVASATTLSSPCANYSVPICDVSEAQRLGEQRLDISSVSGNYYVIFCVVGSSNYRTWLRIHELYMI